MLSILLFVFGNEVYKKSKQKRKQNKTKTKNNRRAGSVSHLLRGETFSRKSSAQADPVYNLFHILMAAS